MCDRCGIRPGGYRGRRQCQGCYNEESRIRMNKKSRPTDYDQMVETQNGLCAICEQPEMSVRNGRIKELSADHNHETGEWRELLCHHCNTGLGLFNDDPELLEQAALYLRKHNGIFLH